MPIKQAAHKALRQNQKRANRNAKLRSDVMATVRHTRKAIAGHDNAKAVDWLKGAIKKIDKAIKGGAIKKNTAGRMKSRLTMAVNKMGKKK